MYFRIFILSVIVIIIYIIIYILSLYLSAGTKLLKEGFSSAVPNDPSASKLHMYHNFSITQKPGNSEQHPVYKWMENKKHSMWKPVLISDYKAEGLIDSTLSSTKTTSKSKPVDMYDDSYKYFSQTGKDYTHFPTKETLEKISSNKPL